jgi:uncharacterized protein (TIGR02246 family)
MSTMNTDTFVSVLDRWKSAVDAHDVNRAATYFTEDAIFQGLHPYSVGREGIAEYYDSLPVGMTANYEVLETRHLADDLVLNYLNVDFTFTDRPTVAVYLGLILRRVEGSWLIAHYQVSQLI